VDRRDLARLATGRTLDVGCGDAIYVWGGHPPPGVVCADLDLYRHTGARATAVSLPFRDRSFDTVMMLELLEHVDDVQGALREAFRVARRLVLISYPGEDREAFIRNNGPIEARVEDLLGFERKHGLVEPVEDPVEMERAHAHWKTRERIMDDIALMRRLPCAEVRLDYGLYDGWGFICDPARWTFAPHQ
jgi:SAM-dependent methyltransferase